MRYPFLDLALSQAAYAHELKAAACAVIDSGRFLHGPETEQLELEIAALCQVRHCVTVSNGLDALRLILRAYKEMGLLVVPGIWRTLKHRDPACRERQRA